tara:strand:- start:3355 stop:3939 length:585 start_codon:yes stop_codon:yes gene_type:complete
MPLGAFKATIFGAAGSGGAKSAWELFGETTVTNNTTTTVSFSSIPQTHKTLVVLAMAANQDQSTGYANGLLKLRFWGAGGGSHVEMYTGSKIDYGFGSSSGGDNIGDAYVTTLGYNLDAPIWVTIPYYTGTTQSKVAMTMGYRNENNNYTSGRMASINSNDNAAGQAAITDVAFICNSNYTQSTRFSLYGVGES